MERLGQEGHMRHSTAIMKGRNAASILNRDKNFLLLVVHYSALSHMISYTAFKAPVAK